VVHDWCLGFLKFCQLGLSIMDVCVQYLSSRMFPKLLQGRQDDAVD
jgi:hypothetical protein